MNVLDIANENQFGMPVEWDYSRPFFTYEK